MIIIEQLVSDLEIVKSWTNVHGTDFIANSGVAMRSVLVGSMLSHEVNRDISTKVLGDGLNGSRSTESSSDLPLLSWNNVSDLRVFGFGRTADTRSHTVLINHIRVRDFCYFIIHKKILGIDLR